MADHHYVRAGFCHDDAGTAVGILGSELCNRLANGDTTTDAEVVLQLAKGGAKQVVSSIVNETTTWFDTIAALTSRSVTRFFNISPGYTLSEYNEEDHQLAMFLRNICILVLVLFFVMLAIRICCAHRRIHKWYRATLVDNVPLDYKAQMALAQSKKAK